MFRKNVILSMLSVAVVSLASCSGQSKSGPPPPPGGNATLSLTMTDMPLAGTSILSFKVTVTGVSLTPSTGKAVSLTLNPTTPIVELTRLQSDSAFLGTSTVPSGNYTSATVAFTSPDIVLINNQTAVALTGGTPSPCPVNAVCEFKPAASGTIILTTTPFPLTLTTNQQTGLSLDFNLNNAITMTNGAVSVDFTQLNVLKAFTLPRTGTPSGSLDLIEDFTGVITTISGNSVTVHSDTRGNITAVANSSTTFNIDPTVCSTQNLACLTANRTVSIDASLNPDGTMTLLEADLLDNVSVLANKLDAVEGTVFLTDPVKQQISIVLSDKNVVNSVLTAAPGGTVVVAQLGATPTFSVDTKGLSAVIASLASIPFSTLSNVSPGQTVRMQVLANPAPITVPNATNIIQVNTNSVLLRFSRVTGTVSSAPAGSIFSLNPATLPPFITSLGTVVNVPVQISSGQTQFDGVSDITRLSQGDTVSIRALFIPPPLFLNSPYFAAKVRKH